VGVNRLHWLGSLLLLALAVAVARADHHGRNKLEHLNRQLAGQVVDYTDNHGEDRRLYSPALGHKRNVYVYLPPCFDPEQRYPAIIWMHGYHQDERSFLDEVAPEIDRAICTGRLPPVLVIAPDGSLSRGIIYHPGSFFINSQAGRYEDYTIQDVWGFLVTHYPIRPEPEAHVLAGASMGGFGAYNLGIKHRTEFRVVVGIFPPLNLRWVDCHGRYRSKFDPECWGWRTEYRRHEVVARFAVVIAVRLKWLLDPLFGKFGDDVIDNISRENPIELIDSYALREGELAMWVGYGGKDEFNTDAQIDSFLYRARERGLTVTSVYLPDGRHNYATAVKLFPSLVDWLAPRLAPYSPPFCPEGKPQMASPEH
jgi:hypothetical protein